MCISLESCLNGLVESVTQMSSYHSEKRRTFSLSLEYYKIIGIIIIVSYIKNIYVTLETFIKCHRSICDSGTLKERQK